MLMNLLARLLLAGVWLLHWLPLGVLAALGQALGRVLFSLAGARRRVALRNLELCFPEMSSQQRRALAREHFQWLARSLLERSLLWYASPARLRRLIRVEGDVLLAERTWQAQQRPTLWLVPHFLAVDVAGAAVQLYQPRPGVDIYAPQSNAVLDAALLRGRSRLGHDEFYRRQDGARAVVRAIKRGLAFFNPADMDFGPRDAAFVPFFGHPAATLLAPSRMARGLNMVVQPVVAEMLPGGQGYVVRFLPPWTDWPSDDAQADAAAMNRFIEEQIRLRPAQYLWVHKRFKTRPPGEASLY
jgi:Kdo2-lipid IVA lauroyltransferase/acyltransferase